MVRGCALAKERSGLHPAVHCVQAEERAAVTGSARPPRLSAYASVILQEQLARSHAHLHQPVACATDMEPAMTA